MATTIGALAVRIGGDASGLIGELGKSKTALGKFGDTAKQAAKSAALITGAVAAAGGAIFAFTKHMADAGTEIARTSRRLGLTTEALSELRFAAELSGVKVQTLDMAMQRFGRRLAEAAMGTGEAEAALKELNIPLRDQEGHLRSSDDLLGDVADALQGVGSESDKVRLAFKLFDSEGVALLNMLERGKVGLDEMRQAARDAGIVWDTEAAEAAERFTQNMVKLEAIVKGVAIAISGPLIEALGEASEEMLKAQKESKGFFATLAAGFRSLTEGTTDPIEEQIVELTDKLIRLQDIGDRLRNRPLTPMNVKLLEENNRAIDETRAKLKELIDFQSSVIPPQPKPTGAIQTGGGGGGGPREDKEKDKAVAEVEARARALRDKEIEVLFETNEEIAKLNQERIDREKEQQQELLDARIASDEFEQELAIRQGEKLLAIQEAIDERKRAQREREKRANEDFWNNLSGLMNTGSKKMFEIGKAAALGQAAVKGASAVMSAWEAGMSVGGPWAPVIAAAYAAAAGLNALNLMNNIRSQQFGGGGGAPVAPTQGASGVSPIGAGGGQTSQQQRGPDTILNIRGDDVFTGRTVASLARRLNEFTRDGGRIIVPDPV